MKYKVLSSAILSEKIGLIAKGKIDEYDKMAAKLKEEEKFDEYCKKYKSEKLIFPDFEGVEEWIKKNEEKKKGEK